MNRKIHTIYDAILKIIIYTYLSEFLHYMGEDEKIEEVLKGDMTRKEGLTEITRLSISKVESLK